MLELDKTFIYLKLSYAASSSSKPGLILDANVCITGRMDYISNVFILFYLCCFLI